MEAEGPRVKTVTVSHVAESGTHFHRERVFFFLGWGDK